MTVTQTRTISASGFLGSFQRFREQHTQASLVLVKASVILYFQWKCREKHKLSVGVSVRTGHEPGAASSCLVQGGTDCWVDKKVDGVWRTGRGAKKEESQAKGKVKPCWKELSRSTCSQAWPRAPTLEP